MPGSNSLLTVTKIWFACGVVEFTKLMFSMKSAMVNDFLHIMSDRSSILTCAGKWLLLQNSASWYGRTLCSGVDKYVNLHDHFFFGGVTSVDGIPPQYPAYDSFTSSVEEEAVQAVKRLRHHPSVVILSK